MLMSDGVFIRVDGVVLELMGDPEKEEVKNLTLLLNGCIDS